MIPTTVLVEGSASTRLKIPKLPELVSLPKSLLQGHHEADSAREEVAVVEAIEEHTTKIAKSRIPNLYTANPMKDLRKVVTEATTVETTTEMTSDHEVEEVAEETAVDSTPGLLQVLEMTEKMIKK